MERLILSLEIEERPAPEDAATDVFFAVEEGAPREQVLALMAELRRRGRSCDTDYARRSLKGQLTQAGRVHAAATVIVGPAGATIRRHGSEDMTVSLDEVLDALA